MGAIPHIKTAYEGSDAMRKVISVLFLSISLCFLSFPAFAENGLDHMENDPSFLVPAKIPGLENYLNYSNGTTVLTIPVTSNGEPNFTFSSKLIMRAYKEGKLFLSYYKGDGLLYSGTFVAYMVGNLIDRNDLGDGYFSLTYDSMDIFYINPDGSIYSYSYSNYMLAFDETYFSTCDLLIYPMEYQREFKNLRYPYQGNLTITTPANHFNDSLLFSPGPFSRKLTINYEFEDGTPAANPYIEEIDNGEPFDILSPVIPKYEADTINISGVMGSSDLVYTVVYKINYYILKIQYQYEDGSEAAPDYIKQMTKGEGYSVLSPVVAGFRPDRNTVLGTMGTSDIVETVVYAKSLIVDYVPYNPDSWNVFMMEFAAILKPLIPVLICLFCVMLVMLVIRQVLNHFAKKNY